MGAIPGFVELGHLAFFTECVHLGRDRCDRRTSEGFCHGTMHTAGGTAHTTRAQRGTEIFGYREQSFAEVMGLRVTGRVGLFEKIQERGRAKKRKVLLKDRSWRLRCDTILLLKLRQHGRVGSASLGRRSSKLAHFELFCG